MSKDTKMTKDVAIEKMVCLLMCGMTPMFCCTELGLLPGEVRQWIMSDKTLYNLFVAAICFSSLRFSSPNDLTMDDHWVAARRDTAEREMKAFLGTNSYSKSVEIVEEEPKSKESAEKEERDIRLFFEDAIEEEDDDDWDDDEDSEESDSASPIYIDITINGGIHIH